MRTIEEVIAERHQGDLISRSALRKDIERLYSVYKDNKDYFYTDVLDHIDNAPPADIKPFASFTFDKDELDRIVEERVIEPIKNGELVIKEKRSTSDWIPIIEGLPEEKLFNPSGSDFAFDFEEVLCTTIWGDVRVYKFGKPIGHDKPHFWLGGGIMDEYVIAWQYKPEPYKEAEE